MEKYGPLIFPLFPELRELVYLLIYTHNSPTNFFTMTKPHKIALYFHKYFNYCPNWRSWWLSVDLRDTKKKKVYAQNGYLSKEHLLQYSDHKDYIGIDSIWNNFSKKMGPKWLYGKYAQIQIIIPAFDLYMQFSYKFFYKHKAILLRIITR